MNRFFSLLSICLFGLFACAPLCEEPISVEDLQICEDLAKSLGIVSPPEPDPVPVPEDPPVDPPPVAPPFRDDTPTPSIHCGEPEGFHAPANGRECTDRVDNDCDGRFDSDDPDCFRNVCSDAIGSRCIAPNICDFNQAKCIPPPPPPPRVECGWNAADPLCAQCPPRQDQETCVLINGLPQVFPDQDRDGLEDALDECPWFNPQASPCPEGDSDSDEDYVPDSVDSCTFVFNSGDTQGIACLSHPEAYCGNLVIDGVAASLRAEINGWPAGWCEFIFPSAQFSIRLCGLGWTLPANEWTYHDSCLDCAGMEVPAGMMCALLSGWMEVTLSDEDGDLIPTEYPQEGFPRDNCPNVSNQDQLDSDGDGIGDLCELVADEDASVFDAGVSDAMISDAVTD